MKLQADLFPYPVLNEEMDDYIDSKFSTKISKSQSTPFKQYINIQFKLNDDKLNSLITNDFACFAVHIEGEASSYRKLLKVPITQNKIEILLNADEISNKLFINCMVIATKSFKNYKNPNFNSLYYGDSYVVNQIEKGDILAFDQMVELKINFKNRENPNAKSMIKVASWDKDYMQINTSGNHIYVYLPDNDYNAYIGLSKSSQIRQKLLLATIILPTLTYTLERLADEDIDPALEWVDPLLNMLENHNISLDDLRENSSKSIEIAQKLLNSPVKDSLYNFYLEEAASFE